MNQFYAVIDRPPYCPNPACSWHHQAVCRIEGRFYCNGSRKVSRFPYITRRFECGRCGKHFSDSIFHLFYRDRTEPTYHRIFEAHRNCTSRRAISCELKCSLDTVQRRFKEMAAQGLLIQAKKAEKLKIAGSVAYDGLENFAGSQYDPNYINHVVGRETLFLYDFNFAPLNRKGRMSQRQKIVKRQIENRRGRYPVTAIRDCTRKLLLRLLERSPADLLFHSDNHYAYRQAIKLLPEKARICHLITPAKLARNFRNRLFAINHCDNLTRHNLATFKRETIAFAKSSIGMIESFSLFMVWKNFMRTRFIKKQKRDPRSHLDSPAMRASLETKVLTFFEFYEMRLCASQVALSEDWCNYVERREPYDRYRAS